MGLMEDVADLKEQVKKYTRISGKYISITIRYRFYRNIGVKGFVYPASARVWPPAGGSLTVYPRYYEKAMRVII